MYSIVMEPLFDTEVLSWEPVKEDPEKAAASTAKRATKRAVKDFMVLQYLVEI